MTKEMDNIPDFAHEIQVMRIVLSEDAPDAIVPCYIEGVDSKNGKLIIFISDIQSKPNGT